VKKIIPLILVLAGISLLSGILMSKPSFIGRVGIQFFYAEYRFLRTWWQGGLTVFAVLLVITLLQAFARKKLTEGKGRLLLVLMILLALLGLYFTWYDFRHTTTHRWLGEGFHVGAYLFWIGWILSSCYFLFQKNIPVLLPTNEDQRRDTGV
jgi:CDP-diglyceride synthetase